MINKVRTQLERWIKPIRNKIYYLIGKAILEGYTANSNGLDIAKVYINEDEIQDEVEVFTPYGFYSIPKDGAQPLFACIDGERNQMIVLGFADTRHKPTGNQGDIFIHNDEDVQIKISGKDVFITCPTGGKLDVNNGNLVVEV